MQPTKTTMPRLQIFRFAKGLGYFSFGLSVVVDVAGVYTYYNDLTSLNAVHPGKAILNTGMGVLGLAGGPYGAVVSGSDFVGEAVHPQGWKGLMEHGAKIQEDYDRAWKVGAHPNKPFYRPRFIAWGASKL